MYSIPIILNNPGPLKDVDVSRSIISPRIRTFIACIDQLKERMMAADMFFRNRRESVVSGDAYVTSELQTSGQQRQY
jgi:hypothetical protein